MAILTEAIAVLKDNIFQKIIDKEIPAKIAYEDDLCLAFHDINPQAPVHVLIIPRKVIATHAELTDADRDLLGHLHLVAVKLAKQLGLDDGYRIVVNCLDRGGQTVPHLHMHLMGGRAFHWPPG
ncbi:MAG: histidine triad nucleotide-binding protein [Planctomycetes bacterium]|nr:histidine triad nucleotide-binding protein [Planctomycetota bacterium]